MATYDGIDCHALGQSTVATGFLSFTLGTGLGGGEIGVIGRPTLTVKKIQIRRLE
jgi:hypothetical protein